MIETLALAIVMASACPRTWTLDEALDDPELTVAFVGTLVADYQPQQDGNHYLHFKVERAIRGVWLSDVILRSELRPPYWIGDRSLVFARDPISEVPFVSKCLPGGSLEFIAGFEPNQHGRTPIPTAGVAGTLVFTTVAVIAILIRRRLERRAVRSESLD